MTFDEYLNEELKLTVSDKDAYCFGYYDGKFYINNEPGNQIHINLALEYDLLEKMGLKPNDPRYKFDDYVEKVRSLFEYPGRLWTKSKIISFWRFPNKEKFKKFITDVKSNSGITIDDDWNVWTKKDGKNIMIKVNEYDGKSEPMTKNDIDKIHLMKASDKKKEMLSMGVKTSSKRIDSEDEGD